MTVSYQKKQWEEWFKILTTYSLGINIFDRKNPRVDLNKEIWIWDWRNLFGSIFAVLYLTYVFIRSGLENFPTNDQVLIYAIFLAFFYWVIIGKILKLKRCWNEENKKTLHRYLILTTGVIVVFFLLYFLY